jgi:prophage regulatory protein
MTTASGGKREVRMNRRQDGYRGDWEKRGDGKINKSKTFLRLRAVIERTGLPASSIYECIAAGTFPKQVPLSANRVAWIEEEIIQWQAERIAKRDQHAA